MMPNHSALRTIFKGFASLKNHDFRIQSYKLLYIFGIWKNYLHNSELSNYKIPRVPREPTILYLLGSAYKRTTS